MYIMYVDESGDPGLHPKSSPHFILSGLIVSQNDWDKHLTRLKAFRKSIKAKYGLNQREEIHAAELIRVGANDVYKSIRKSERIALLKDYANEIPSIFDTSYIINICIKVEEHPQTDIFELAWRRLFQRYDTFLKKTGRDKGIIVADDTQSLRLMKIYREMRVYNPTPSHFSDYYNAPIDSILEDVFSRPSQHSYFIQTADVIAHLLYRKEFPKGSLKKFGVEQLFSRFEPILLKAATKSDPLGIIRK